MKPLLPVTPLDGWSPRRQVARAHQTSPIPSFWKLLCLSARFYLSASYDRHCVKLGNPALSSVLPLGFRLEQWRPYKCTGHLGDGVHSNVPAQGCHPDTGEPQARRGQVVPRQTCTPAQILRGADRGPEMAIGSVRGGCRERHCWPWALLQLVPPAKSGSLLLKLSPLQVTPGSDPGSASESCPPPPRPTKLRD